MTGALDQELARLQDLDCAVRCYLSHLYAFEQGADQDLDLLDHWRTELQRLTDDT
jgi:hypothetical protein